MSEHENPAFAEQTLGEQLLQTHRRSRCHQAIETSFRAAVERATGRRVISFVSATKLDHHPLEIFRRASPAGTRPADPEDG